MDSSGNGLDTSEAVRRGLDFLLAEQHDGGQLVWFAGASTMSTAPGLCCARFNAVGLDRMITRRCAGPIAWLMKIQNQDGGWGEDDAGYAVDYVGYKPCESTASQTAWALLGLMAAGEVGSEAVRRGIAYLEASQSADGFWDEVRYTAVGFPRVFYLRYGGYPKFFPLWALARYRNLQKAEQALSSPTACSPSSARIFFCQDFR